MKTLIGSPSPRPRNAATWTTATEGGPGGNRACDGTGGGNTRIDWNRINEQR